MVKEEEEEIRNDNKKKAKRDTSSSPHSSLGDETEKNEKNKNKVIESDDVFNKDAKLNEHGVVVRFEDLSPRVLSVLKQHSIDEQAVEASGNTQNALNVICNSLRFLRKAKTPYSCKRSEGYYVRPTKDQLKALFEEHTKLFAEAKLHEPAIGKGAFGSVYLATSGSGKQIAIKLIEQTSENEARTFNEAFHLSKLKHSNIVQYLGSGVNDRNEFWLAMEYMEGGTLREAIQEGNVFSEKHLAYVARGVLSALRYLHRRDIIHRDLKSENIMLTVNGRVKLIDFGLAVHSKQPIVTISGSPYWLAPELVQLNPHHTKADVYSMAISLLELANRQTTSEKLGSALEAMFRTGTVGNPTPLVKPKKFSKEFKDFLGQALTFDPEKRPTAKELSSHPWLECACDKDEMKTLVARLFIKDTLKQTGLMW
mmetsp:Transcript_1835/g.2640  ORF Transcript_1835/g.2640 Transcript_1835/m.2640 type:complete len:425 (-) Transcript_1835:6-1280(-)